MFIILAAVIACSSFGLRAIEEYHPCCHLPVLCSFGYGRSVLPDGLHLPWFCPGHGLCRWRVVLYVFAILLTRGKKDRLSENTKTKIFASALLSLVGFGIVLFAIFKQEFLASSLDAPDENVLPIKEVGVSMLSTDFNG